MRETTTARGHFGPHDFGPAHADDRPRPCRVAGCQTVKEGRSLDEPRPRILEARCTACDETFCPVDETDLEHVLRDDETECGGAGVLLGGYYPAGPKTVTIDSTWHATVTIDLADVTADLSGVDWGDLNTWPDEVLEQVTTAGASLADWDARLR